MRYGDVSWVSVVNEGVSLTEMINGEEGTVLGEEIDPKELMQMVHQ